MSNRIVIPADALVMLVGPAASGKSTFAHKYFQDSEIVSSDQCRLLICDDMESQVHNKEAFELFHYTINLRLKLGYLTVADATNLKSNSRSKLFELAMSHNRPVVVVIVKTTLDRMLEWNKKRTRYVPEHILEKHYAEHLEAIVPLTTGDPANVYMYDPFLEYKVDVAPKTSSVLRLDLPNGVDVIGDIHGCGYELDSLLYKLGYRITLDFTFQHPEGRKIIFVGDFTDRGPENFHVLVRVHGLVKQGLAYACNGNHDNKLRRWLKGNKVKISHGLDVTVKELERLDQGRRDTIREFLESLPHQIIINDELVVAHAGFDQKYVGRETSKAVSLSLFGPIDGKHEDGMPIRNFDWQETYDKYKLVTGHTPYNQVQWIGNTICVDGGCVFGGSLNALRWPENTIVSVPAKKEYATSKGWVDASL